MSKHKIGIIGGTGLYNIEGFTNQKWVKVKTPFGAPSDDLLTGKIAGRDVVFLPRHGRGHKILPSELNHRANIWAMKKLGVAWIISVSAVGSLQEKYKPCDIVLINQFLDRTKQSHAHTFFGRGIVAHIAFADPVCEELRQLILQTARAAKATVHDGGTYVCMEGPAFSTRAESLANHRAGYDVIGMTNLGEAKCAREPRSPTRRWRWRPTTIAGKRTRHTSRSKSSSPTCTAMPTQRKKSSHRPSQKFRLNRTGVAIPR